MSKTRPGIFDPWRQSSPPPLEEPQKQVRVLEPSYEDVGPAHCVQFPGIRAGLNVWLTQEGEDPSTTARGVLVDLVYRLYLVPKAVELLTGWGIYNAKKDGPNPVVLGEEGKQVTIHSPDDGDTLVRRAVDTLSLALRECASSSPQAEEIIAAMKVKPYVK